MCGLTDVARFRAEDPGRAGARPRSACPVCLRAGDVAWAAGTRTRDGYDASVRCECGAAGVDWRVYVAPHQALRLSLLAAPGAGSSSGCSGTRPRQYRWRMRAIGEERVSWTPE